MKVWWCEEHKVSGGGGDNLCEYASRELWIENARGVGGPVTEKPCRMVEMQLVPADALVIQKVNSEWPTLLIMELADLLAFERGDETVEYHEARRFFDSLLVASVSKAAT